MDHSNEILTTCHSIGRSTQIYCQKGFRRYELAAHCALDSAYVGSLLWPDTLWPILS